MLTFAVAPASKPDIRPAAVLQVADVTKSLLQSPYHNYNTWDIDASAEDLCSLMCSMMLLSMLLICDELPHGGVAQALRLQPIASSTRKTKTGEAVNATQKPSANKKLTHSQNQM